MEKYETAIKEATKYLTVAEHVLNVTYPLLQDPKILKFALHKIFLGVDKTMAALLCADRQQKKIPPFNESFVGRYSNLEKSLKINNLSTGYLNFVKEIKEITDKQKESDIEFIRKDKFVFASGDYKLSTITEQEIKDYLRKAKFFMKEVIGVIHGNERITKRR